MSLAVTSGHTQTRQQLDELDSLLQRMLALPLNGELEPVRVPPRSESFAPLPPSLPTPPPAPVLPPSDPVINIWRRETPQAIITPSSIGYAPPETPPRAEPTELPYPYAMVLGATPPPTPPFAEPLATAMAAPAPMPYQAPIWASPVSTYESEDSFLLWPFVAVNRLFDGLSHLLPLGSLFRSTPGRNLLGGLGIVMILASIGLAIAGGMGVDWTP